MPEIIARKIEKVFRVYQRPHDRLLEFISRRPRHKTFTALEDISFSLTTGDTIGLIGCNGAGKSTLLKILAKTLTPTSGSLEINGRVMALLELGSGFNPEFTGRENIFLNASLLGMSRDEINRYEEAIIEFADIGPFIDRPVKTYSSGMYVRLAFSIATSVDPDILIIDEALSVGDDAFQRKCIRRMNEFREAGKILLFCSHSMYQVNILCQRAIWIDHGHVQMDGPAAAVTREYEDWIRREKKEYHDAESLEAPAEKKSAPPVRIVDVQLRDENGTMLSRCRTGQRVILHMVAEASEDIDTHFGFAVFRSDGLLCFCAMGNLEGRPPVHLPANHSRVIELEIPEFTLLSGEYRVAGGAMDKSELYIYHLLYSEDFIVTTDGYQLGITTMAHEWKFTK